MFSTLETVGEDLNATAKALARCEALDQKMAEGYAECEAIAQTWGINLEDMELGDLFAEADRVGNQYQTDEERAAFQAEMDALIADLNLEIE